MEEVMLFFAVGTFWFWAVLAILFCAGWAAVSNRHGALALVPLAASVAFLQFVAKLPVWQWAKDNWQTVAFWSVLYAIGGLVHLTLRWVAHTREQRGKLEELRTKFCAQKGLEPRAELTQVQRLEFARFVKGESYDPNLDESDEYDNRYDPAKHGLLTTFDRSKYTVGRWLFWWIWCLFGLLDDYVAWAFRIIRENLRGFLNWLSVRMFGDLAKDSLTAKQAEQAEQEERREREREQEERRREQGHGDDGFPGGGVRRR